jgi:hypothetical protein
MNALYQCRPLTVHSTEELYPCGHEFSMVIRGELGKSRSFAHGRTLILVGLSRYLVAGATFVAETNCPPDQ